MGKSEARRQKQLARHKAKRTEKRENAARGSVSAADLHIDSCADWPVTDALVTSRIWENGVGELNIGRLSPRGVVCLGCFLVDTQCLGVKNAFATVMSLTRYREVVAQRKATMSLVPCSPEYLSKLVHCAADYAQSLGFPPHPDFADARRVLDGIDPSRCGDQFAFGRNGKPFYIRGPGESPHEADRIARRVAQLGGKSLVMMDR